MSFGVLLLKSSSDFCQRHLQSLIVGVFTKKYVQSSIFASCQIKRNSDGCCRCYSFLAKSVEKHRTSLKLPEMSFVEFDKKILYNFEKDIPKMPVHSKSFADYMNYSKTLQALVMLGVELFRIEKSHPESMKYIIMLDLNNDLKPKLQLLLDIGVLHEEIGHILSRNPKILDPNQSTDEINEIVHYLKDKKFNKEEILSVIVRCPAVLTIPVTTLDGILGFFQRLETHQTERKIIFSNNELRSIILSCPRLIMSNLYEIHEHIRTLEVSCDFTLSEIRQIILGLPSLLIKKPKTFEKLYKYYAREMGYSNQELMFFPEAFNQRAHILMERHSYLKHLKRAIYKRDEPGYISLSDIYLGTDDHFCERLGLGSVLEYKKFIKTL